MNPNEINSARNALLEVAERFRQQASANQQQGISSGQEPTQPNSSSILQSNIASLPVAERKNLQVMEHRRLFGYSGKGKGSKKGNPNLKQKIQTCTLKLVCLASASATKPPTTVKERTLLANSGLGDTSVTFNMDGNSSDFHNKILETFPKLRSAGYQLSLFDRSGENSSFCQLRPPYVAKKLKEIAGQCKIYIKPLQKDLIDEDDEDEIQDDGPQIPCIICNVMIPMSNIEEHHQSVHDSMPKYKKKRAEPCIYNMMKQADGGENSRSFEIKNVLHDLLPTASQEEINAALNNAGRNADEAAQQLLGLQEDDDAEGLEIINTTSLIHSTSKDQMNKCQEVKEMLTLQDFRCENINDSLPRQRFTVSREDGLEELKRDILGCYKNPMVKLKAKPRIKFEGEEGVGSGPIREFFLCAVKIAEDGIEKQGKPSLFFVGEDNHKVPVHDHALRCTGAFTAIGRIIGHSVLHEGPVLYGLSPAIVQYWRTTANGNDDDVSLENLPLTLQDIPDVELRSHITQLENLALDETPSTELKELLAPYIFESGLDLGMLSSNRKLLVQGLVTYNVIYKRKRELDDIAKGMNEVDLHTFIGKCASDTLEDIFPDSRKRIIDAQQVKEAVVFEESAGNEETTMFFFEYLCDLEKYEAGKPSMTDLCCFWTAMNRLPPSDSSLLVKFDTGESQFPFAETCFLSIVLPTVHKSYEEFRKYMDIALNHGAMGLHHS